MIYDKDANVNLVGALVLGFVLAMFCAGLANGAEPHPAGVLLTEDEFRQVVEMRDVTIPRLEAEVEILTAERESCKADLKFCQRPLRQPAVNVVAGAGMCVLSGWAIGQAGK